jgi:Flp pilus assembly protein TadG
MRMLRRWSRDVRGGIAMTFAIAAPVLALLVCGAIDLAGVSAGKSALQSAADSAALNAAHQLGLIDESGVEARADAFIRETLKDSTDFTYTVAADVADKDRLVTITIEGNRPSFFANMLPPGGWNVTVHATAKPMARRPLCVLNSSNSKQDDLTLVDNARIYAPDCMISSNAGITVAGTGNMTAAAVQSSLAASGAIYPSAMVGAPEIADPFSSLAIKSDGLPCQLGDVLSILGLLSGDIPVPPGVHCGNFVAGKNQTLRLQKGEHYFLNSKLVLKSNAKLIGEDVTIVFGSNSSFEFTEQATVKLKGRKTGPYAGFVIATTRQNTRTFTISSDNAKELLGTIYVPNATLQITGTQNEVAEDSAWTVILAKQIEMTGSAKLVVNAEYDGSGVPVPKGVGPLSGVALSQ